MVKTVLITGASSGFGEAMARRFAQPGYNLILAARREDRLTNLARELESKSRVHRARLDVRSQSATNTFLENPPADLKQIDILINNAGLALGLGPVWEASTEDMEVEIDTNIKALVYLTRMILPGMVARRSGHVINIGSVAGSWPYPGGNVYGATKSFVRHFSYTLRADLVNSNVRVTNIEPGLAKSEFSLVRYKGDAERAQRTYKGAKPLSSEDVADMVFWVTSLPEHININALEVMPTCQALGPYMVSRTAEG